MANTYDAAAASMCSGTTESSDAISITPFSQDQASSTSLTSPVAMTSGQLHDSSSTMGEHRLTQLSEKSEDRACVFGSVLFVPQSSTSSESAHESASSRQEPELSS